MARFLVVTVDKRDFLLVIGKKYPVLTNWQFGAPTMEN